MANSLANCIMYVDTVVSGQLVQLRGQRIQILVIRAVGSSSTVAGNVCLIQDGSGNYVWDTQAQGPYYVEESNWMGLGDIPPNRKVTCVGLTVPSLFTGGHVAIYYNPIYG